MRSCTTVTPSGRHATKRVYINFEMSRLWHYRVDNWDNMYRIDIILYTTAIILLFYFGFFFSIIQYHSVSYPVSSSIIERIISFSQPLDTASLPLRKCYISEQGHSSIVSFIQNAKYLVLSKKRHECDIWSNTWYRHFWYMWVSRSQIDVDTTWSKCENLSDTYILEIVTNGNQVG